MATGPEQPGPKALNFEMHPPREEVARIAESQRVHTRALADLIQDGKSLDRPLDREWVAGILRAWADQIPDSRPGKQGPRPKIDPGTLAFEFAVLVNRQNLSENAAIEALSESWDVSITAIKKQLPKFKEAALLMVPRSDQNQS